MKTHFFTLDFSGPGGTGLEAELPLFFDGRPLEGVGGIISSAGAGSMHYARGVSSPERDLFLRRLGRERGFDPALVRGCTQIHSRIVAEAEIPGPDKGPEADGLVTGEKSPVLAVTVADCLPVFLYDTAHGVRALVHSGWKGTGIALWALALMAEKWGTRAEDTAALLGPCIQNCCYAVDEERAAFFEGEFGGVGGLWPLGPVVRRGGGASFLDLQAANARILANAGVRNFTVCENCTSTDKKLGSFRREGESYTRMICLFGNFGGG